MEKYRKKQNVKNQKLNKKVKLSEIKKQNIKKTEKQIKKFFG